MLPIGEGVYWCARDLKLGIGNHHFILLVTSKANFDRLGLTPHEVGGTYFCTLAAFKEGFLKYDSNNLDDIQSVKEKIAPDQYVKWNKPDFSLEYHKVSPPQGTHAAFIQKVATLATNYEANQGNAPAYSLWDENCACWVNTLLKCAGISDEDREEYGEFFGIDWGEEDLISESLYTAQDYSIQNAGYFPPDIEAEQALESINAGQELVETDREGWRGYFIQEPNDEQSILPDDWSELAGRYFDPETGGEQSILPDNWFDREGKDFNPDSGFEQSVLPPN
jgi:hypothetical protein